MKTKKFLAIAALAAGFVSCSSEDEFVQSQDGNATKGESTIELAGYAKGKANSRAVSTDIPAGDTDFATTESKDIRVFFAENTTAGITDAQTYSETGYKYTALNGNLTQVLESGQSKPMWSKRSENANISCYAFYPANVVYPDKFLATTNSTASTGKGSYNDFDILQDDLITHCAGDVSKVSTFDASGYNTKLICVEADQSNITDYQKSDVYVGYPNDSKNWDMTRPTQDATNKLSFYHAGDKVTVKLVADNTTADGNTYYTAEQLATAKVELLNWPVAGAIYPLDYNGLGGFVAMFMQHPTTDTHYTDAAGKTFNCNGYYSIGTTVIAANQIGSSLSCSALIPHVSKLADSFGFRITIGDDAMTWYCSKLSDPQLSAIHSAGVEYIFKLTVSKKLSLPIRLTDYDLKKWTTSEYNGKIE